jgi:predicted RNase H-like nuclease (RuvC/YqgF family)
MLEPFLAAYARPVLTSEIETTSKFKGADGSLTMESLMESIRDKNEEINQLRNRTTQVELETETLKLLLKEKDKKIEKLQNNLTQVLQEKGEEFMELQQKTTKTAYEMETLVHSASAA